MLKYRIFTALLLLPLFLLLLFKASAVVFCLVTGAFMVLAAWEWSFFMGVKRFSRTLIYPAFMVIILFFATKLYMPNVMWAALIGWLLAFLLVVLYPRARQKWGKSILIRGLMGVMVLVPSWLAINFIRDLAGVYTLLFLFILVWGADIGAYFVGRSWGKHKLAPAVSPGKTWEGLLGALIITTVIAAATAWWTNTPLFIGFAVVVLSIVTVLFSVLGDLYESMLKRNEGLKDSSRLLPGHGGILDRIDSLTAAAPIFLLGALLMQKIL